MSHELNTIKKILGIVEELGHIKDLDTLLDRILLEARHLTNADAGSIYLREGDSLKFSYVQNDTLFTDSAQNKYFYSDSKMNIDEKSIAGYVAHTGKILIIDDAYDIDKNMPFTFNTSFDKSSNYRTKSIMTVPLKTSADKIIGVLQIINAKNEEGESIIFNEHHKVYVDYFATNAAVAIERTILTRELILRMLKMSELRDPKETGAHVNRVGAYCAEIYEAWAKRNNVDEEEIKSTKDVVRLASMLHDVGKVAISDLILKKPAKLTDDEFEIMKFHTIYGAKLFSDSKSDLDKVCEQIALTHHEKWDGTGYPGRFEGELTGEMDEIAMGQGMKGEEIPLFGRICAVADVYDALISKRVYKDAWNEDSVLDFFREQKGRHFDPEIVDDFLGIYPTIIAIRNKFRD